VPGERLGEIELWLEGLLSHARADGRWLDDDDAVLSAFVLRRWAKGNTDELTALHADDLGLVFRCLRRDRVALEALDRLLEAAARPLLRRRAFARLEDDLVQTLRQKLLLGGADGSPKLDQYAGRGSLAKWLAAVAARTAISLTRNDDGAVERDDERDEQALGSPDPELQYLKARYRPMFKEAFRAAFNALQPEQRTLLRLQFIDGLTHEQIARLDQVHQTTVTRRIQAARTTLVDEVQRYLVEKLSIDLRELKSLVRAIRSELEVSMGALVPKTP